MLPPLPVWFTSTMLALNVAVGGTIVFTLLALFAKQRGDALHGTPARAGQAPRTCSSTSCPARSPKSSRTTTRTIADQFSAASILFADVVDFTPRSEHLAPAEVVGLLDHLFSHFDTLAERYGLEKIKTIGDCYMVAAGVPDPRPDHARALVLMALDMLDAMRSERRRRSSRAGASDRDQLGPGRGRRHRSQAVPLRPVGRRGQHGQPDGIARDAGTDPDHAGDYELLGDEFECEPRGTITVKGKGEMEAWFVLGRRSAGGKPEEADPVPRAEAASGA